MLTQRTRHLLLQRLFWNQPGAAVVETLIRYERLFNVVVRNYSLIGETNGERWLLSLLDEAPTVFDVGFHKGQSTQEILRVRSESNIIAFDPSLSAQKNYESQYGGDGRVSFENLALSSNSGKMEFFDYENMCNSLARRKETMAAKATVYVVPVNTLDSYCEERAIPHINFIKIDAEGFDLHVLEGAHRLLTDQAIDILTFEFASGWASSKRYLWEAVELFQGLPYKLFHLFNGFLSPLVYDTSIDSCCTLPAMYVAVSEKRLARGDIPQRNYRF